MKILYAAGNRLGSYYQLKRFLNSVSKQNHNIKIAAYKNSTGDLNTDYTLDCLLNFTSPHTTFSFNGNYTYYSNEIKRFNPDLIISDFEIYTSIIAAELNIKLWQYSPINIYYALDQQTKQKILIHKYYSHLLEENIKRLEYINSAFDMSNRRFVLSHLCDNEKKPNLTNNFEWVRPSFILGAESNNFQVVIALAKTNKDLINNKNAVMFLPALFEKYDNLTMENINNEKIYKGSIESCKTFVSDGTATFLADAFYNQKYCYSAPRYDDLESVACSRINEYYDLGSIDLSCHPKQVKININKNVKFISEYLREL
jgi:hypothetical protein